MVTSSHAKVSVAYQGGRLCIEHLIPKVKGRLFFFLLGGGGVWLFYKEAQSQEKSEGHHWATKKFAGEGKDEDALYGR